MHIFITLINLRELVIKSAKTEQKTLILRDLGNNSDINTTLDKNIDITKVFWFFCEYYSVNFTPIHMNK